MAGRARGVRLGRHGGCEKRPGGGGCSKESRGSLDNVGLHDSPRRFIKTLRNVSASLIQTDAALG